MILRRSFLKGAMATAPLLVVGSTLLRPGAARAQSIGPSTTIDPYLLPSVPGVQTVSILTVGDSVGGYRMVGIPDGLGALRDPRQHVTLLMNHELGGTSGVVRKHGSKGAFVSRWTLDRRTLEVVAGEDFTQSAQQVFLWDATARLYVRGTTAWERHCSADLPRPAAFFHEGKGTRERLYMNGEEVSRGRAWARVVTGVHAGEAWRPPRHRGEQRLRPRRRDDRLPRRRALQPLRPWRRLCAGRARAGAGLHRRTRDALPASRGRRVGSAAPAPRRLLLRDHGESHQQLPAVAPALRRRRAPRAGRDDRDPPQRRRGSRDARQRDHRPLRPDPHGRGSGQQPARVEDLALPDRHRRAPPR